jgi:hypothetical protein
LSFSVMRLVLCNLGRNSRLAHCTEKLSKKETVALLKSDALPVTFVRPKVLFPTHGRYVLDVPRVLIVGREASRMGGLGDLAMVNLLEGVEALAGGRHSVHQMHFGD